MAIINDTGNGMYMPVAPAYGGGYGGMFGGAGNDWWGILLLIALLNGGMFGGLGGWGGMGGMWGGLGIDFPWILNGQQNIQANTNNGFRDAMLNDGITGIRDSIVSLASQLCECCGNIREAIGGVNLNIAQTGNTITGAVRDGFYGAEIAANGRHNATTQNLFNIQSTMQNGFCENRAATQDVKYTIATEACANRANSTANTQLILDKLCQLELDNEKARSAAKDDTIAQLRSQLQFANMQASQVAQTAELRTAQAVTANNLVSELRSCPIPAQPVYGNTPIWTCAQNVANSGCGCGVA